MALTERYASSAGAGAHDGTSEGDAWSLVEACANATAGTRINYKGNHTLSAHLTAANAGTVGSPIILRGYATTPGDGYLGRTSGHGPLVTTNMPTITNAGNVFSFGNYWIVESMQIGASYGIAIRMSNYSAVIGCYSRNSGAGGSPTALTVDPGNSTLLLNSDFEVTGSTSLWTVNFNSAAGKVIGCRFKNTSATTGGHISCANPLVLDNIFGPLTPSAACAISLYNATTSLVYGNTFYGIPGDCVRERNVAEADLKSYINNHATDCGRFLESLYQATGYHAAICAATRRRDNTNADRGFGDWPEFYAVTADDGDATSDFEDAANYDFRLKSTAAGVAAGLPPYRSIGALQLSAAASSGGGQSRGRHQ